MNNTIIVGPRTYQRMQDFDGHIRMVDALLDSVSWTHPLQRLALIIEYRRVCNRDLRSQLRHRWWLWKARNDE
jgi:hypothetical protein